jgi:pentatricopeptide repeat protein
VPVGVMLMNKLYEMKRYDDAIRVYTRMQKFHSLNQEDREEVGELLLDVLVEKVFDLR